VANSPNVVVTPELVDTILGGPKYSNETAMRTALPGITYMY
jgi:hypothetical protein